MNNRRSQNVRKEVLTEKKERNWVMKKQTNLEWIYVVTISQSPWNQYFVQFTNWAEIWRLKCFNGWEHKNSLKIIRKKWMD